MPESTISWIDFSAEERRRKIDVVRLFPERSTLDELGQGTVCDALADRLLPGTSTIQTRVRYFLFVPWLYRSYEIRRLGSAKTVRYLRRDETRLIAALTASDGPLLEGQQPRNGGKWTTRLSRSLAELTAERTCGHWVSMSASTRGG